MNPKTQLKGDLMEQQDDPGKLETWAIVEVMGHNRFAGFVQQVPMGGAAMIRIDVPAIPDHEEEYDEWSGTVSAGMKKKKRKVQGSPAFTKFLGVSSIFAITPCSKEVAITAVKQFRSAPVMILEMPARRMLSGPRGEEFDE
jgi:hypothetical protein